MSYTVVRYPKGGGGNWLSNVIWHLENSIWQVPATRAVYDGLPKGSLQFAHWGEFNNDGSMLVDSTVEQTNNIIFSTACRFNLYLNYVAKQRWAFFNSDQLALVPQIFDLSNSGKFIFSSGPHNEVYCKKIDLNYALIFQDRERFIDQLFELLIQQHIEFEPNRSFVHQSIDNYSKSVLDPADHIDNPDSVVWAGWCHAMSLVQNIELPGLLTDCVDLRQVFDLLQPCVNIAKKLAQDNCFKWKK